MWKQLSLTIAIAGTLASPAFAQFDFAQPANMYPTTAPTATGQAQYPTTAPTAAGTGAANSSMSTGPQSTRGGFAGGTPALPPTYYGQLAQPKGLPPTRLDSLVKASGYNDQIYGDEGTYGPPPYFDFQYIEEGLPGGLTTNHRSSLPSAWGTPY